MKRGWKDLSFASLDEIKAEGLDVHFKAPNGNNLLVHYTCCTGDENPFWKDICLFLIENGVDVNHVNKTGNTALTIACELYSFEAVEFLVENGADIHQCSQPKNISPLMFACFNKKDYARIIPFLVSKGANLHSRDAEGDIALNYALANSSLAFGFVLQYYDRVKLSNFVVYESCADPHNCWIDAITHGCLDSHYPPFLSWKLTPAQKAWFERLPPRLLKRPKTLEEWRYAAARGSETRDFDFGDTLLHLACRQNNAKAVEMIIRRQSVNPYIRNFDCLTADALTSDPKIIKMVQDYKIFKPTLRYADWLGPYFVTKALALLLVNQRLRLFPKPIVWIILSWIANLDLY